MLRLIGLIVVIGVLYVGFGEIKSWYQGDSTPQEMVDGVKQKVGESLVNPGEKGSANASEQKGATESKPAAPETTQDRLRNMLKDN